MYAFMNEQSLIKVIQNLTSALRALWLTRPREPSDSPTDWYYSRYSDGT